MARSIKKPLHRLRYILLSVLLIAVLAGICAFVIAHTRNINNDNASTNTAKNNGMNSINYSPPTPNDNTPNNERKSSPNPSNTLNNGPTANSSSNPLGVVIINAIRSGTDVRVGNIISGTTSGTCTLSATQTGQNSPAPISAQVHPDVNNYDCGVMHIALPNIGTWQIKLTVTSGTSNVSATTTVGES